MKKLLINVSGVCLGICLMLCACANDNDNMSSSEKNVVIPRFEDNYFEVFADDLDVTFGDYSCTHTIPFSMVSTFCVSETTQVKVYLDNIECKALFEIEDNKPQSMNYELFKKYLSRKQGEESQTESEDEREALYDSVRADIPSMYQSILLIEFPVLDKKDVSANELIIEIDGMKKIYKIKNLIETSQSYLNRCNDVFVCNSVLSYDVGYAEDSRNNNESSSDVKPLVIKTDDLFSAKDQVLLKRIFYWNHEDVKANKVIITQSGLNREWDISKPMEIFKNDELKIEVEIDDPNAKLFATYNRIIMYEYEYKGETYITSTEMIIRPRNDAYTMLIDSGKI